MKLEARKRDLVDRLTFVPDLPMRRGETPTTVVATGEGWDLLGWKPEFRMQDFADTVEWYAP